MIKFKNESIIQIIERTLNYVDCRLVDHGLRVAYLFYRMLKQGEYTYTEEDLRDLCLLALMHDFGAYKTEEINNMVKFEAFGIGQHAIYGYLILKNFSPRSQYAEVILYHHASCSEVREASSPFLQHLAQCISITDRADIFAQNGKSTQEFIEFISVQRGIHFFGHIIDLFLLTGIEFDTLTEVIEADEEFHRMLYHTTLYPKDAFDYLNLLINALEFRSHQTALHTESTIFIAEFIANQLQLDEDDTYVLITAALLHDIGKVNIPLSILESPRYLDDQEIEIMRKHVLYTDLILKDTITDRIRIIATRHHEKINGSGYPCGLALSTEHLLERILSIADILSALMGKRSYKNSFNKKDVCLILIEMSREMLIDIEITQLVVDHYDELLHVLDEMLTPIAHIYETMQEEFTALTMKYNAIKTME